MTDLFGQDASPPSPGVPAADAPLADRLRPASLAELGTVGGVGAAKLERYGPRVLEVLAET